MAYRRRVGARRSRRSNSWGGYRHRAVSRRRRSSGARSVRARGFARQQTVRIVLEPAPAGLGRGPIEGGVAGVPFVRQQTPQRRQF